MIKKILTIILFALSLFAQQNQMDQNQFMLAESFEQRGDLNKAVEIVETLNKKDPSNIQYFNKLNSLYLQLKKYDESVSLINSRININPQDFTLYGMLGSTYYTAGDQNKAYETWDNAIEKFKDNEMVYRIIANYIIEKRDFEKAIEILNKGKSVSKDPFLYSYQLGELYNITMRYPEAAEEYCKLIQSSPSQYQQIENKILSYSNKLGALDETIAVVNKYKSENISFEYLLARLLIEKKDFGQAFTLYQQIDKKQGAKGNELYSFAQFVFRDGEYSVATKIYKYLIDNYPDQNNIQLIKLGYAKTLESVLLENYKLKNPEWKTFYVPSVVEQKDIEPVIKAYQEIIQTYQHSEVAVESNLRIGVLLFHLKNDFNESQNYLKTVVDNYPTSKFAALAFIELGNIALINGDLRNAEKYFQSVGNLARANPEDKSYANYQLSKVYSYKGDFDSARKILLTVLGNLKDNTANDAIEYSVLLNTAKNDSSNLSIFCNAEFLAEQRKFSGAEKLYVQLAENPQAFIFHSKSKLRSAEMMIAENNYDGAIASLQLIVDEGEKNIYADKALYLQGQIYYYGLKNPAKAIESYENLLAKFPKSLLLDDARQKILELKNKIS